jgi:D-cysteine desulfhydrase
MISRATSERLGTLAGVTRARSVVDAYARAIVRRLRSDVRWIPAGGSAPLGALGHVNAALELAEQLNERPVRVVDSLVVPLGSGGTVAGLLVGLSLARLKVKLVGVRVVPRMVANRFAVIRLARRTHALLQKLSTTTLPPLDDTLLEIEHGAYGGAYARETDASRDAALLLRNAGGPVLDGTYSAKAFAVALGRARREHVLFWLTFDGRWLQG